MLTDQHFHIIVENNFVMAFFVAYYIVEKRVGEAESCGEAEVGVVESNGNGEDGVGAGGGVFEHLAYLVVFHTVIEELQLHIGDLVYVAVA